MAVSIKLDKDIEDRLYYLSKETGRTIQSKIKNLEDIYLAEKSLEDLKADRSLVFTCNYIKKASNI